MQSVLIIVHSPACAGDGLANALQLARGIASQQNETVDLRVYFMSGSLAGCAAGGSDAASEVLADLLRRGAQLRFCATHPEATAAAARLAGAAVGNLGELAQWTLACDKVVCF